MSDRENLPDPDPNIALSCADDLDKAMDYFSTKNKKDFTAPFKVTVQDITLDGAPIECEYCTNTARWKVEFGTNGV